MESSQNGDWMALLSIQKIIIYGSVFLVEMRQMSMSPICIMARKPLLVFIMATISGTGMMRRLTLLIAAHRYLD